MRPDEYTRYDALALAELVRNGEVTPAELLDCAIEQVSRLNPTLNAVIDQLYDRARQQIEAGLPQGQFTGVPILLKDDIELEGTPMTLGSRFLRGLASPHSHVIVERLLGAGFTVVGRSNMSELGLLPITEPIAYGPTRNPWSLQHSPGGSSGGAAAAVAARIVPLAQSSDGGGSTRIPASACGLFGLKPSRGRNPTMQDEDPDGFIVRHCLTRTVRDSAAYLDVTHGPRAGDRWWAPPPQEPYQHTIRRDPPKLRVAFYTSDCDGHEVHPECKAAVDQAARLCEALGHQVGEAKPAIDVHAFNRAFVVLWATCAGYYFRAIRDLLEQRLPRPSLPLLRSRAVFGVVTRLAQTGGMRDAPFERFTHRLARIDASGSPADLWLAWRGMRLADVELARFFENYDVLLCPVLGEPPWKIGEFSDTWSDEELRQRLFAYIGTTHVANTTGLPALSVPLHLSQEGLPIGTQVLAPWAREDRLLALAAQLERAEPWHERRPPLKAESQDLAPGRPGN